MGTDGGKERSVMSDPTKLSKEVRECGHVDVTETMPQHIAALTKASGTVSDHRRLVAFVYLLLRDNMPCGLMAEILKIHRTFDAARREQVYRGFSFGVLDCRVAGLVDGPSVSVCDWLALVYLHSPSKEQVTGLLSCLPVDDDVETVFTNGWVARYAQYVVEELLSQTDDNGCT